MVTRTAARRQRGSGYLDDLAFAAFAGEMDGEGSTDVGGAEKNTILLGHPESLSRKTSQREALGVDTSDLRG